MPNRLAKSTTTGVLWIALAIAATTPAIAQPVAAEMATDELLNYRWRLQGVAGLVAWVFFPVKGESTLRTASTADGRLESELKITAKKAREDFWLYGALIEPIDKRPLRAWNAYRFRKREKERRADLDDPGIIDITSGIYLMRTAPPPVPRALKIWTDGKVYPVLISAGKNEQRKIGDRSLWVTHHSVTARKVPGERVWSGRLDIWLAPDEASTPVEIDYRSKRGRVRMVLEEPPA